MADGFKITWTIVQNDFPKIIAGMEAKADALVTKAAMDIEAHAKSRVPVDTGTLKNSIQARRKGNASWEVVVGADYGVYVEWGTARMGARPFIDPAVQAVGPGFLAAMKMVTR